MIGDVLGDRYELLEKIGEGGMAIVYKARDKKLSRLVAVKVLKKEFADNKEIADKFKKEATAVANFSDSNIVNVLDVGHEEEGNIDYFVMEFVDGKTLKDFIIYNSRLSYLTAINITVKIAKALECAHKNNIIHRDVKPQNILITENGEVKVTDFGIAKSSTSSTITNTTTIMGSAHYLSPEQAKGTFVDSRSDIYSLGIVLYEMVTGKLPFDGESPVTIALKHIQEEPVEPKSINDSIPESLNNLIMKCIKKEPVNRYENCRELINDLQKIKENPEVVLNQNDDYGKTIIMQPIKIDNNQNKSKRIYTKSDFEDDYNDDYEEDNDYEDNHSEEKIKSKSNKGKKKKSIIIGVVIALLLLTGVIVGAVMISNGNSLSKDIPVPDIIGMDLEVARKELKALELELEVIKTTTSDKAENTILETLPAVNTLVEKGSTIQVTVSGGEEKVKVPDLRDYEINYIKDFLSSIGLQCGITEEYDDKIEKGYLISQYPEKYTEVAKDSVVDVIISKGPETKLASVENYVGYKLEEAKSELENLNLVVDARERETDRESEDGIVLEQPLKGTKVEEGTTIILYYGKYVPTVNIGDYIWNGMNLSDAINALTAEGISYSITGGNPPPESNNLYVIKKFTNNIKKGETVKLDVEKISQPPSDNNNNNNNDNNNDNNNGDNNSGETPPPTE